MTYKQTQCLIFSKAYWEYADREHLQLRFAGTRARTRSVISKLTVKAVALLPRDFCNKHQSVVDHFSKNDVHIARNGDELNIEKKSEESLSIFECRIDENLEEEVDSLSIILTPKLFLLDRKDLELIFDKTRLKIRMEDASCTNALTRPAIDDQNTEVFKHLLKQNFPFDYTKSFRITRECIPRKSSGGGAPRNSIMRIRTPLLSVASSHGLDLLVQLLLDHGADVNAALIMSRSGKLIRGPPPLFFAAKEGNATTAKLLLERGAHLNPIDIDGATPLYIAAEQCFVDLAEVLLQYGNMGILGDTPLHLAIKGEEYFLKYLLYLKPWTLDDKARGDRDPEIFNAQTPLQLLEDLNIAKEQKRSKESTVPAEDADATGFFELGEIDWLEHILRCDPRLHGRENNSLQSTVSKCRQDLTRLLLDHGADVNALKNDGRTPLHVAVAEPDNSALVELLLERGAFVDAKNKSDQTPLHVAAKENRPNNAKVLLQHGADIEATSSEGYTPLHYAAAGRNDPSMLVQMLVDKGAAVNKSNRCGETPLIMAKNLEVAKILLENDADPNREDNKNRTPLLSNILRTEDLDIIKMLLDFGARITFKYDSNLGLSINGTYVSDVYCMDERVLEYVLSRCFVHVDFENSNESPKRFQRQNLASIFARHLVRIMSLKLQDRYGFDAADFWVWMLGNQRRSLPAFQKKCEKEVIQMKSQLIAGTDVSVFDLLAMDEHQVARLLRSQSVTLDPDELKKLFPIYGLMLTCVVEKGRNRFAWQEWKNQAIASCNLLSSNFKRMPDEIKEIIASRLCIAAIRKVKMASALLECSA